MELKSISFPRSFPIDIMHLFFENIAIHMFKHWTDTFYKNIDINESFILSNNIWKEIGNIMHSSRKQMPLYLFLIKSYQNCRLIYAVFILYIVINN